MKIKNVIPLSNHTLRIESEEGRKGIFNVKPYLKYEVFEPLIEMEEFMKISNGGYFVEWECGADLSADTIEPKLLVES